MKVLEKEKGFTLVEIMIVIATIGLLASIGIPHMLKASRTSRNVRFVKDIQCASNAFQQYTLDTGNYPADTNPGEMPDGMAPYLSQFPWSEKTAIGGSWDWDANVFGVKAGLSVKSPGWMQMGQIDKLIDDGDLATGLFRARPGGFIYIIEE